MIKLFHLLSLLMLVGCSTYQDTPSLPQSTAGTLSLKEAKKIASHIAKAQRGRVVGKGQGLSMHPLYNDKTLIVTSPLDYKDLEVGMIVAFKTPTKNYVVHRLVSKQPAGWVTQGIYNKEMDPGYLTKNNFVGVVYATIYCY